METRGRVVVSVYRPTGVLVLKTESSRKRVRLYDRTSREVSGLTGKEVTEIYLGK